MTLQKKSVKDFTNRLFLFTVLFSSLSLFSNDLKLGSLFQEHMVLQRNMPINIWGKSLPSKQVNVALNNKMITVVSDAKGNWKAILPKFKAGGPFKFSVTSEDESIIFKDVMIGEVWICAGQSNMVWPHKKIKEIHKLDALSKNIRTFEMPQTVAFQKQNNIQNGVWALKNPSSAVAFSFSYFLQKNIGVPVGVILTAWGSSSIEGWLPREATKQLPHFNEIMETFDADQEKNQQIKSILNTKGKRKREDDIFLRRQPNILYNAMMNPIIPYTSRGLVWYQGESNTKTKETMLQYKETFTFWADYLRNQWQQSPLEIIVVALPGYIGKTNKKPRFDAENPTEKSWAWMRASQFELDKIKNVSVVTTIDLGKAFNIHPSDKLPVGKRVALLAEKVTFNKNGLFNGPIFKNYKIRKNKIIIKFFDAKGLTTNDTKAPRGFWISDKNKKWHKATAVIKGKKVIIKGEGVEKPLHVRYAFSAKPDVNLVNKIGLPARPFRTDTFQN
ncbi:sialate O-acetylesterase [Polaribacter sp. Asnod6-C07]|uniref:sialate O-acetylesterase n=1 Tax=Polaribacter sp. Asnod6-C07 TaxID=3160582 RepID=UPI003869F6AB